MSRNVVVLGLIDVHGLEHRLRYLAMYKLCRKQAI